MKERLLSVAQVAERLGTTERFPRRLIAERRITFVKVGRHVRIPESAVSGFIASNTVQPFTARPNTLRRVA
ncbi:MULTISPECIES: excisionase family DNA-binding protein [Streptomyces]|uniref:Helix-turn-helix domain-containing protein n=1 Tax=Streptomyces tsukubensis (strain DSM 42081 / NBRC 108919 / NRRL 18488 / 9993) TaxID=1114943 RepID=I2N1S3_STRT9|nr:MULTISPECIES: excisionase family DNA-binding protein [Streptomyces]AZK95119.1 DNA-binding protein [Streptomyces tsukubensis]EIF90970.1 excisionase [Streptomyces tsukubensis NRRL18488]MYS64203.1 excisionase family DNA-binding protein [Streptomyces sp. SID5473]QKM68816.1 helix-turn-helix domain-containing protein [Streptomyces tsukubensis NRRL18488]TAI43619.1 helix-turn-helix domain-containing protein [Streptomyces tsukubensis]